MDQERGHLGRLQSAPPKTTLSVMWANLALSHYNKIPITASSQLRCWDGCDKLTIHNTTTTTHPGGCETGTMGTAAARDERK